MSAVTTRTKKPSVLVKVATTPIKWVFGLLKALVQIVLIAALVISPIVGWLAYKAHTVPMGEVGGLGEVTLWEYVSDQIDYIDLKVAEGDLPEYCNNRRSRILSLFMTPYFVGMYYNKLKNPSNFIALTTLYDYHTFPQDAGIYNVDKWGSDLDAIWLITQYSVYRSFASRPGLKCYLLPRIAPE